MTTISAEAVASSINLLTDILVRLHAKQLIKFKCVSKRWLSLISDPQFCHSHARRHHHNSPYLTPTALLLKKPPGVLRYAYSPLFEIVPLKPDNIPTVPLSHYLNDPRFHIRQSCNGLLLYSSPNMLYYYVCNPTIKQFKRLSPPPCEFREHWVKVSTACLAFDPLKSNHYKIICFPRVMIKTDKHHIDMYSSKTDSWSPLEITFTLRNRKDMDFSNPVFCNGALQWYTKFGTSLYFDVDRECFNTMPKPNLVQPWHYVHYFGESRGHLHLIVTHLPLQSDVLEMAADYSGWFVRFHVNLDTVRIQFPDNKNDFLVLHVVRAQKEEESVIVLSSGVKIISYNIHDGTSKELYDLEHPVLHDYTWRDTFQYFETLAAV